MNIGAHVSTAGGVDQAPLNASRVGCECFQFFTRSPRGGPAPELTSELIASFVKNCRKYGLRQSYVHTPYYINLASSNSRIRHGSIEVIRQELDRASQLGVTAVMTHLGSTKDLGALPALTKVIEGLEKVLAGYRGTAQLLLENSAGAGATIIVDTLEEIVAIISALPKYTVGVCFDTCHAFASGYDLRANAAVAQTMREFDTQVGLQHLKLIHSNDSKEILGSHLDRHEHIGDGKIGKDGFRALLQQRALQNVDFILETPHDGKERNDLAVLKELRAQ